MARSAYDLIKRFKAFHETNPKVYDLFRQFTLELLRSGRRNYGAQGVLERIRWHFAVRTAGDAFKVNNDFAAFYARMFMFQFPEYLGFFRRRGSAADSSLPPETLRPLPAARRTALKVKEGGNE